MTDDTNVADFANITGASTDQAQFYLDSAGGNLEAAVNSFMESAADQPGDDDDPMDHDQLDHDQRTHSTLPPSLAAPSAVPASSAVPSGGYTLSGAPAPPMPAGWGAGAQATSSNTSSRSNTPKNPFRSNAGPRVSGFRELNSGGAPSSSRPSGSGPRLGRVQHGNEDEDDQDENDPQSFFTGGEKSGLSVQNPDANPTGLGGMAKDMMKNILQKASDGAAKAAGIAAPGGDAAGGRSLFSGSAHTLGSDEAPSTFIPDPTARPSAGGAGLGGGVPGGFPGGGAAQEESDEEEETAIRTLTFWQDGFSIDDGDLLRYEDPNNAEILAAINSGRAPLSLLNIRHDQPVELRIAKRTGEKWARQPSAPSGPFGGSGHRLGSETDPAFAPTPAPAAASAPAPATAAPASAIKFEVDQSQPTTNLQIRLTDGSRLVARFNHTHTVGDIRSYINASNPGQASTPYALQTTFPNKDLTDDSQTIKDANLLGSVVVQRAL